MIQPGRSDPDAIFHGQASVFDVVEVEFGFHLVEIHRKVRRRHLLGHDLLKAASARGGMKNEFAVRAVVERTKEGHALDVIPMKVRDENMRGERLLGEFLFKCMAQHAESSAAIEDVDAIPKAYFHARGIPPVAQVLGLWSGRGTAHAPKLDEHKLRYCARNLRLIAI